MGTAGSHFPIQHLLNHILNEDKWNLLVPLRPSGVVKVPHIFSLLSQKWADKRRMADFSIPLGGMSRATSDFNRAASGIARATVPPSTTESPVDTVDLSHEMVALLQAKNDYAANAKAVRVFDEMNRATLDMLG